MQIVALLLSLLLALALFQPQAGTQRPNPPGAKQLFAVRGEIVAIKRQAGGLLLITVRPDKGFAEASALARENDLIGSAVRRPGRVDLFGLLADDEREDETITAAELNEGDVVSIIYDPAAANRSLEIYIH
ncbi:MAG TPA: hypothetical protein VNO14_07665 [Blastocatellia bacterium]|nr:hypothetical protein [Blastocatellia bacterium]